jgi:hypothetical protein
MPFSAVEHRHPEAVARVTLAIVHAELPWNTGFTSVSNILHKLGSYRTTSRNVLDKVPAIILCQAKSAWITSERSANVTIYRRKQPNAINVKIVANEHREYRVAGKRHAKLRRREVDSTFTIKHAYATPIGKAIL